MPKLPTLTKAT